MINKEGSLRLILVIFTLTLSINAAAETLDGAFGIKFGQQSSELEVIECPSGDPDDSNLEVAHFYSCIAPPNPNAIFNNYYIYASRMTGEVAEISAYGHCDNNSGCKILFEQLSNILRKKYDLVPVAVDRNERDYHVFSDRARKLKGETSAIYLDWELDSIYIEYQDTALAEEADRAFEQQTLDAMDKSGL
jgi:hypothetical protein